MLNTLTLFQGAVQQADDKARTVVAIQTMLTAMVVAQLTFLTEAETTRAAQLVVLAIFVPAYIQSSWQLLRSLIPRTAPTSRGNQFAFPNVASGGADTTHRSPREQCAQVREVVHVLASLAMLKYRHVRRAMYGTCALFASALASLVVTVVS